MKAVRYQTLWFLLASLLLLLEPGLEAQQYYFDVYGVKQGLGHSKVNKIMQASNGYIWIGTPAGVSKFDGLHFTNYSVQDGLAPFGVSTLFEDPKGNIWIGHLEGRLTRYRKGKFERIMLDSVKGDITGIAMDDQHRLWISTTGSGAYRIDKPYERHIKIDAHLQASDGPGNIIFSMTKTRDLGMIFVTRYGVKYYNKHIKQYDFVNDQFFNWPQYFQIIKVCEDSLGGFWVGTYNGGLYHYPDINSKPRIYDKRDGLGDNFVSDIYIDNHSHTAWLATFGGGVTQIDSSGRVFTYSTDNGLPDAKIKTLSGDVEGNILIGSYSKGLAIFKGDAFLNFRKFKDNKAVQVQAINRNGPVYFFGTTRGLIRAKAANNKDKHFETEEITADGINLQSNDIRFIKNDHKGKIWIGTWGGGIVSYDIASRKIGYPIRPNTYISQATNNSNNVTALEFDHNGDLWIGTYGGLIYYNIDSNQVAMLGQRSGLWNNDISALYCDEDNTLWIGNRSKGLSRLQGTQITTLPLPYEFTPTCMAGNSNDLWVGTEGLGLIQLKGGKIVRHYTIDNGMSSNLITAITVYGDQHLLIGTNTGLNRLNLKTGHINQYGPKDGFVGIEVKPNAILKDKDNGLWVGTAEGVTLVNPDKLRINKRPPMLELTKLLVNLEPHTLEPGMKLPYADNSLIFYYKGICISDESEVVYKVRLIGIDKDWQPITQQDFANYPSLPAGQYIFQVKARNNSGVWNEEPIAFAFSILPPFYQTWWFYSILAVVFAIALVLFIKIRERNLKREKAELERKVQERTLEIREKNQLLARKNKDITDSINYARRIQRAMMPSSDPINKLVKNSFIYYRPKDIVSGDFHWNTYHNERLVVAAADCTGHGVPGAFMSMISISSLNKIVKEKGITDPGQILDSMRRDIINDLKQSGDVQAKDGLDIALLSIDTKSKTVYYAGAYNSMYIIKRQAFNSNELDYDFNYSVFENRLIEVKADRMPIGVSERMDKHFSTKSITLETGDTVYITTDGYIDQFGGEQGKKYMSKRFKRLLLSLPWAQPDKALKRLDDEFINWRGAHEQIDDVLVIGICF